MLAVFAVKISIVQTRPTPPITSNHNSYQFDRVGFAQSNHQSLGRLWGWAGLHDGYQWLQQFLA